MKSQLATTCFVIGSLIGVSFGVGMAKLVGSITSWPIAISLPATLIAIAAAAVIGIFFGYYPARKASRLNPIEALRYDDFQFTIRRYPERNSPGFLAFSNSVRMNASWLLH